MSEEQSNGLTSDEILDIQLYGIDESTGSDNQKKKTAASKQVIKPSSGTSTSGKRQKQIILLLCQQLIIAENIFRKIWMHRG